MYCIEAIIDTIYIVHYQSGFKEEGNFAWGWRKNISDHAAKFLIKRYQQYKIPMVKVDNSTAVRLSLKLKPK